MPITPVQEDHADLDARLETPAEPLVKPEDVAVFTSASRGLRLVRVPGHDEVGPWGVKRRKGLVYEFDGGYLRITEKSNKADKAFFAQFHRESGISDEEFENLDKRPAEEWLRDHDLFKVRFHEIEKEVHIPDPAPLLEQIALAAAQRDIPLLEDIVKGEQEGYRRPSVIHSANGALEALGEVNPPEGAPEAPEAA